MQISFYKYHGAGNDFVMIDDRKGVFPVKNKKYIKTLCDRRLGIGADGLILLRSPKSLKHQASSSKPAFSMVYANADGSVGSMCGNGGRCIVRFAHDLGLVKINTKIIFDAVDGLHEAVMREKGIVELKMVDMALPTKRNGKYFNRCGTTPHYLTFIDDVALYPLFNQAQKFRDKAKDVGGVNYNIAQKSNSGWLVRTYERGVEDETFACGTGACAVATILYSLKKIPIPKVVIRMPGGILKVQFVPTKNGFENVWLTGPTEHVFEGQFTL